MTFPNMDDAFWDWTNAVELQLVTTTVGDFEARETPLITETFDGVLEPVHPRNLLVKPEGQRTWKWWSLWTTRDLRLNQIIRDAAAREYRVMSISDWSNGGYRQYELVQDPPLGS